MPILQMGNVPYFLYCLSLKVVLVFHLLWQILEGIFHALIQSHPQDYCHSEVRRRLNSKHVEVKGCMGRIQKLEMKCKSSMLWHCDDSANTEDFPDSTGPSTSLLCFENEYSGPALPTGTPSGCLKLQNSTEL